MCNLMTFWQKEFELFGQIQKLHNTSVFMHSGLNKEKIVK